MGKLFDGNICCMMMKWTRILIAGAGRHGYGILSLFTLCLQNTMLYDICHGCEVFALYFIGAILSWGTVYLTLRGRLPHMATTAIVLSRTRYIMKTIIVWLQCYFRLSYVLDCCKSANLTLGISASVSATPS